MVSNLLANNFKTINNSIIQYTMYTIYKHKNPNSTSNNVNNITMTILEYPTEKEKKHGVEKQV